ncbi:MAG: hypothetical protein WCX91_02215 [Candidatus Omnitrophota bacterium]
MLSTLNEKKVRLFSCGLLAFLILVAGCSSVTLKSQRLATTPEPGKEFGIIYQMSKPKFTITTNNPSDASAVPKYTLNVEFVPDAERRFAVSSNPRMFSNADLSVGLNSNGAMTSLTQTTREQVTPTIKAIGDFVTSIGGAAATVAGVMLLEANEDKEVVNLMKKELTYRLDVYTKNKDLIDFTPGIEELFPDGHKMTNTEKVKLKSRLIDDAETIGKRLAGVKNKKNYTIAHLAEALKPEVGTTQIYVLKALAKPLLEQPETTQSQPPEKKTHKQIQDDYNNQVKTLENSFPKPIQTVRPLDDAALVERELAWERELIVKEVEFAKNNEDLLTLFGYSSREVANAPLDSEVVKKKKKDLLTQSRDLATTARDLVMSETTFPKLLGPLIKNKTPAQQIYEQIKDVQMQIFKQRALLASEKDAEKRKEYMNKITKLTREFHELIGAQDEYAEIVKLQEMIKDGPPKAANVAHSSPLKEYAETRAQLAALNEAVTLKLGMLASDAAETTVAKKSEWNTAPVESAFCWNVRRELMEGKQALSQRILVSKGKKAKAPTLADRVASRVAQQSQYGAEISSWPKYVVVIEEVKP